MLKKELVKYDDLYKQTMENCSKEIVVKSVSNLSKELMESAQILRSIIVYLINVKSGVPAKSNENVGNRIWLHQIFNQGFLEAERHLFRGQYFKAAICLKQDMEILVNIRQIKKGIIPNGKTPNVSHGPKGMGKAYGILNAIGHVSQPEYYNLLEIKEINGRNNVSPLPVFSNSMINDSYIIYVWILFQMTKESILLFREMFPDDKINFINVMEHFSGLKKNLLNKWFKFK